MNTNHHALQVNAQRCTACGRCVAVCGEGLFTLETVGYRKHAIIVSPERCSRCLKCPAECPVGAITPGFSR